ncbi:MAG: hypothetical protein HKP34_07545 [Nitrosopumilus sp.]|nr:hypothetical protein [Nitrosopumilus sp.]NNL38138.1 hypothetical protein [Nitrosopumilus sp.]
MSFETRLKEGEFCIPKCNECKKIVWPPSDFCNNCFGKVSLEKGDFEGKIIEFSSKDEKFFGIIEFENTIRIMANILKIPKIGETVKISKCGIDNENYFFQVS